MAAYGGLRQRDRQQRHGYAVDYIWIITFSAAEAVRATSSVSLPDAPHV
jgi:hypothetical protein